MKRTKPGKEEERNEATDWAALTWDDLDQWAGSGSVSRGRSYQNQGRVKDLAIAADDRLLATVLGGDRYVVCVWLNAGEEPYDKIKSHCTCPVGYNCKHAVATVAAYLQALTDGTTVPTADPDDPRWRKLSGADAEFDEDLDDEDEDDEDDDQDDDEAAAPARDPPTPSFSATDQQRVGRKDRAADSGQEPRGVGGRCPFAHPPLPGIARGVPRTNRLK